MVGRETVSGIAGSVQSLAAASTTDLELKLQLSTLRHEKFMNKDVAMYRRINSLKSKISQLLLVAFVSLLVLPGTTMALDVELSLIHI